MPITPLHFGILAPVNYFFPKKVSNLSFILTTLLIDISAIQYYLFNMQNMYGGELHPPTTHSFAGTMVIATLIGVCGCRSYRWICGAVLAALTHIALDAMVHAEIAPFHPIAGNIFYWGGMEWVSLLLLPTLIWLIVQYVSGSLGWLKKRLAVPDDVTP